MKNHTAIYYHAGAYGTFVEWCLNYFSDEHFNDDLPFTDIGNAHLFQGNLILSETMFNKMEQNPCKFFRTHPGSTNNHNQLLLNTPKNPINCYINELQLLQDISEHVIVLYFNSNHVLWGVNNIVKSFSPVDPATEEYYITNQYSEYYRGECVNLKERVILDLQLAGEHHYKQWNKNSWGEMDNWQLREFLSLYLQEHWVDLYNSLEEIHSDFPNITFLELGSLRDNFKDTISTLLSRINLPLVKNNFDYVFDAWISRQTFANRDAEVNEIVSSILSNKDMTWKELSIIDEAVIQKKLRDNGINLKCFDLDIFPRSVKELKKIFE